MDDDETVQPIVIGDTYSELFEAKKSMKDKKAMPTLSQMIQKRQLDTEYAESSPRQSDRIANQTLAAQVKAKEALVQQVPDIPKITIN